MVRARKNVKVGEEEKSMLFNTNFSIPTYLKDEDKLEALVNIASVLMILGLWFGLSFLVDQLFLPSPKEIFVRSIDVYGDTILTDILTSLTRTIIGFLLGGSVGVLLGVTISWNKYLEWWFSPIVEVLRPVPVLALIPLFIVWFGIGELGKILLISFGVFVRMVVTTREAILNISSVYLDAAKTLGATKKGEIFRSVIFPAITPELIGGLRVAAAAAFGYCAAAEFLGAQRGLGYLIIRARRYLYTFGVMFGILAFGALSLLADRVIRYIDRNINEWAERTESSK